MYTLHLIQKRDPSDTRLMLWPEDRHSGIMLGHVANNSIAITIEHWEQTVKPLVNLHGWEWQIDVKDKE